MSHYEQIGFGVGLLMFFVGFGLLCLGQSSGVPLMLTSVVIGIYLVAR